MQYTVLDSIILSSSVCVGPNSMTVILENKSVEASTLSSSLVRASVLEVRQQTYSTVLKHDAWPFSIIKRSCVL